MQASVWYYVDRDMQRHGPVPDTDLLAAFHAGRLHEHSAVWREGMPAWSTLSACRGELGLPATAAHAPPPYAAPPARMSRGLVWLLVGLAVVVLGIPVLAVVAAIALPAYQDYVLRSQVHGVLADIRGLVTPAEEFRGEHGRCPASLADLHVAPARTSGTTRRTDITLREDGDGQCIIEGRLSGGNPRLDGIVVIRLARQDAGRWSCGSEVIRQAWLPAGCTME